MTKSLPFKSNPLPYIKHFPFLTIIFTFFALLSSALLTLNFFIFSIEIDFLTQNNQNGFYTAFIAQIVAIAIAVFFAVASEISKTILVDKIQHNMRMTITTHAQKMSYRDFKKALDHEYYNWYNLDIKDAAKIFVGNLKHLIGAFGTIVSTFLLLTISISPSFDLQTQTNYIYGLIFILAIVLNFIFPYLLTKRVAKMQSINTLNNDKVSAFVNNLTKALEYVSVNRYLLKLGKKLNLISQEHARSNYLTERYELEVELANDLINFLFVVIFFATALSLLFNNQVSSIGFISVIPLVLANGLSANKSILAFFTQSQVVNETINKWKRNLEKENEEKNLPLEFPLVIRNYESPYVRKSLKDELNLKVNQGDKILITGNNGVGKSVLVRSILGLENEYSGQITWGKENVKNLALSEIFKEIAWITPENYLFNTTQDQNISLSSQEATDQEKLAEAKKVALVDFTSQNEEELFKLSTGQKQRLDLARGFYEKRKFIILDEALSNLDAKRALEIEKWCLSHDDFTFIHVSHILTSEENEKYTKVINL